MINQSRFDQCHERLYGHQTMKILGFALILVAIIVSLPPASFAARPLTANNQTTQTEEFVGPFANWANVQRDYGAVGDGQADDTAALQHALNDLGTADHATILYIPEGTYRITQGLTMTTRLGISIFGADPATTIIKWDGETNGTMFFLDGVSYSRFGRLTWDGSQRAGTAVQHKWSGPPHEYVVTHNEHADEFFQDVGYGIRAGDPVCNCQDAETVVLRSHFIRNTRAGVSIEGFNANDWFIWDSLFDSCAVGVTNDPVGGGGGNFHVYQSIFRNSSEADITINNTLFFSIRNNFSTGSKAFFVAKPAGRNGAESTLQGNTILDTQDVSAIRVSNLGPVTLLDNIIRSQIGQQGPQILHESDTGWPVDLISIGNTYTEAHPIQVISGSRVYSLDDKVVEQSTITSQEPTLPPPLTRQQRPIFEIPVQADSATIQDAIDSAAQMKGQRPIIHLPRGQYRINQTLSIPSGSDLQLVGDGFEQGTILAWASDNKGPVLHIMGPSHATLRDLQITGNNGRGDGIIIDNADQSGSQVRIEQANIRSTAQDGVRINRLNHTMVELRAFYQDQNQGVGLRVIGGSLQAAGVQTTSRVNVFGGTASNNTLSYDLQQGGRLLVQDIWFESGEAHFVHLRDTGSFTLQGARIAVPLPATLPTILADDFRGTLTVLATALKGSLVIQGEGQHSRILAAGLQFEGADGYFANTSSQAQVTLLNNRTYVGESRPVANQGDDNANFIRTMLSSTRSEKPGSLTNLPLGVSDIRLYRVAVSQAYTGIQVNGTPIYNTSLPLVQR